MKKNTKKLLILLAVLVVVVGAYFLITHLTAEQEEENLVLFTCDIEDIAVLSFTNENGELSFEREGGKWSYTDDVSFPANHEKIEGIASELCEVAALRRLDGTSLSEVGLEEPEVTVTAELKNGEKATFLVGNYNSSLEASYIMMEGDEAVYTSNDEFTYSFNHSLLSLAAEGELPETLSQAQIYKVSIENEEGEYILTTPVTMPTHFDYAEWQAKTPAGEFVADTAKVSEIANQAVSYSLNSLVAYNITEADKAQYGLDNPQRITVDYIYMDGEEEKEAQFGAELAFTEEGNFVLLNGDDKIYKLSEYAVSALKNINVDSLMTQDIVGLDFATVDGMKVEAEGKTYDIKITRGEKDTAAINGKTVGVAYVEGFFSDINNLVRESVAGEPVTGQSALKVSFYRNTGDEFAEMTLSFTPYNTSFMAAGFEEANTALVNIRDVEALIKDIAALEELAN